MVRCGKRVVALVGLLATVGAAPVAALDNLSKGKTVQQLYSTDCAVCHNDARKVAASMPQRQLAAYLAEHYTTGKTEAAALADYLAAISVPERERRPQRGRSKKSGKAKSN